MKKQLSQQQIDQLKQQGCTAQDWSQIHIHEDFDVSRIRHTAFYGNIEIGGNAHYPQNARPEEQGISHATLRNVSIGDHCCINHVGLIESYAIGNGVRICRVNELTTNKWIDIELCKEGLSVGNEAGDPNIHFTLFPDEKLDWIGAHYPHLAQAEEIEEPTGSPVGFIQDGCDIANCGIIRNVNIDQEANIHGAAHLEDGLLHQGCHIGTQVIAKKFSIGQHTRITDGAKLYHVITTNDCRIGKGFMAENSYFSHHCELYCGEACAIFAGPHTVSHHKSTLLIGGEYSFYNAGSNTNQSNHAYKLGPVHYGTLARGSKTASGCHILWPMQTAPFCMIMGKVKTHPDLSGLPFSYIIAENDKVYVAPGMNLGTAGTFRDVMKWKQRGQSPYPGEYSFFSPLLMQSVFKGISILENLQKEYGTEIEHYPYNGTLIRRSALEKGLKRYALAVQLYAGTIIPEDEIAAEAREWHWIDAAGLPTVEENLGETYLLLQQASYLKDASVINDLNNRLALQTQQWGAAMLAERYGDRFTSGQMRDEASNALEEWKSLLIADAYKELSLGDVDENLVESFVEKVNQADFTSF